MMNQAKLLVAMNDVPVYDEFQSFKVYRLIDILKALESNGLLPHNYFMMVSYEDRMELVDEACEVLDSVIYSHGSHMCWYPDGVKLALANSCRGFVLEDLS